MPELIELKIGDKYGKLTIISKKSITSSKALSKTLYYCQCECGKFKDILGSRLRNGGAKSCGCSRIQTMKEIFTKHGKSKHNLYEKYAGVIARCEQPTAQHYDDYGGRGIKICAEWRSDFMVFYNWAIKTGWTKGLTIDRIDVNGDYSPLNCMWATRRDQAFNKRRTVRITYRGETKVMSEWADELGITRSSFRFLLKKGKSLPEILNRYNLVYGIGYSFGHII